MEKSKGFDVIDLTKQNTSISNNISKVKNQKNISFGIDDQGLYFFKFQKYLKLAGLEVDLLNNMNKSDELSDDFDASPLNKKIFLKRMSSSLKNFEQSGSSKNIFVNNQD